MLDKINFFDTDQLIGAGSGLGNFAMYPVPEYIQKEFYDCPYVVGMDISIRLYVLRWRYGRITIINVPCGYHEILTTLYGDYMWNNKILIYLSKMSI